MNISGDRIIPRAVGPRLIYTIGRRYWNRLHDSDAPRKRLMDSRRRPDRRASIPPSREKGNVHVTTLITADAARRNLLRQVVFLFILFANTDTKEAVVTELPPRRARFI